MKILKMIVVTVALSAAIMTTAHARDSFSIGINVGGYDHHAPLRTHRHAAPVYYDHYGVTEYYSAPRIVYYDAPIRYRHDRRYRYSGDYYGNRHYKQRGKRHHKYSRKHHSRSRDNYYGYGGYGRH